MIDEWSIHEPFICFCYRIARVKDVRHNTQIIAKSLTTCPDTRSRIPYSEQKLLIVSEHEGSGALSLPYDHTRLHDVYSEGNPAMRI